jgi:hypothetical protein
MSKWSLFLFAACLWGLSHLRPLAYHSDGLSQSIWSVSSADGELVWAWVELSGPDPERELGTTAAASLEGYINESRGYLCRVHSESQGSSRSPGAALSQIHKYSFCLSWLLLMAICLVGALWRSRRRQKASANAASPPEQAA